MTEERFRESELVSRSEPESEELSEETRAAATRATVLWVASIRIINCKCLDEAIKEVCSCFRSHQRRLSKSILQKRSTDMKIFFIVNPVLAR